MRGLYVTCKFPSLEKDLDLEYFDWKYSVVPGFDKCLEPQTTGLLLQYYWSLTIQNHQPAQLMPQESNHYTITDLKGLKGGKGNKKGNIIDNQSRFGTTLS